MIWFEDRLVKVGGVTLPGVLKSIEVKESAKIDEQEVEGSAAKPKQATGYEDAKITIELLVDDSQAGGKYQRIANIRAAFRAPGQAVPQPMTIVSQDTAVHGIDKVLFKGLSHKAENKKGQLPVTLEFWEYIPETIKATKASSGGKSSGSTGGGSTAGSLTDDYSAYLSSDRGRSPAVDDASAAAAMARVAQMPY